MKKTNDIKSIFKTFWEEKVFKIALFVHLFYLILGLILTLTVIREFNDFLVFYEVGKVFIKDIKNLYDPTNYLWPFRYFPLMGIFFVPFSLLPFEFAFIFFNIFSLFIKLLICVILYKIMGLICKDNESNPNNKIYYISLYLIALPHAFNYTMGQVNSLVTIMVLISLYIMLKYRNIGYDFLGGLCIGMSINIKPITAFIIPFLITFSIYSRNRPFNRKELKHSIIRIIGVIFPLFLNIILFLIIPELLNGFLEINFTGTETLKVNNSFSITKLIINFLVMLNLDVNFLKNLQVILFFLILLILGGFGFLIFILRKVGKNAVLYGFILGIVITLLVYFDSWDLHLIVLIPLLLISLNSLEEKGNPSKESLFLQNIIEKSVYFFVFIDLLFFGLMYLLKDIFPYNFIPTIFLLLIYVSIGKYLLTKGND